MQFFSTSSGPRCNSARGDKSGFAGDVLRHVHVGVPNLTCEYCAGATEDLPKDILNRSHCEGWDLKDFILSRGSDESATLTSFSCNPCAEEKGWAERYLKGS